MLPYVTIDAPGRLLEKSRYTMSCYFRHLNEIFDEAGIVVTAGNRKQIDQAIHQIVGVNYKDCPQAWKKLKQQIIDDEQQRQEFINKLKAALC